MSSTLNRALFLDRDGVVNEEVGYLHRSGDIRFVAGIFPLCRTAQRLGYKLIVVTNQAGIGRGFYTLQQYEDLTRWILAQFAGQGITLDEVLFCPYHPVHGVGEYKREHDDRKPSPGMLLRAARNHNLDLSQSILIGDRCSDIAAANAAQLRRAFYIAGTESDACPGQFQSIARLSEVEEWLLLHS